MHQLYTIGIPQFDTNGSKNGPKFYLLILWHATNFFAYKMVILTSLARDLNRYVKAVPLLPGKIYVKTKNFTYSIVLATTIFEIHKN